MNLQEAKDLLSAYLQSPEGESDTRMLEALQMADSDPELQEWIQQQAELDPQIRDALAGAPVPENLESDLLKTVRVPQVVPIRSSKLQLLWSWGFAAAVLIGVGTVFFLRQNETVVQDIQAMISGTEPDDFGNFREGMAYYVRSVYFNLDHHTKDLNSIQSWLEEKNAPVYETIPKELTALVPIGCKQLSWQDRDVSLVCFHTGDGKIVHMFILDRDGTADHLYQDITKIATSHDLETGGWLTDSTVYLLVGSDPQVDVEFALG